MLFIFTATVFVFPGGRSEKTDNSTPRDVTISILIGQGSFKSVMNDMAEAIYKDYGYIIDFQVIPDDQFYDLVKAKLYTSELPDILAYNTPSNHAELNVQTNCVSLNKEPWVSRLVNPGLLADGEDGKIYAMPRASGTFFGAMYFNKKTLDDLGINTDQPVDYKDFLDRLEQIKVNSNGRVVPVYASNKDIWTTQIFMTLGFSVATYPNDGKIYQKLLKNELKFTDVPEFEQILTDYKELYTRGYVNKDNLSATYDMSKEAVATGKAAMAIQGEWFVSDINTKWPDVEMGSWLVPFNNNNVMAVGAFVRGWFLMKNGKQVEEARKFMDIWSRIKYMNMYFQDLPGFPPFKDVNGGKVDPAVQHLVDTYLSTNKYTYQINDPMKFIAPIWPDLWRMYVEMVSTDKEPAAILKSWQKVYADFMQQEKQTGF